MTRTSCRRTLGLRARVSGATQEHLGRMERDYYEQAITTILTSYPAFSRVVRHYHRQVRNTTRHQIAVRRIAV